jgi:hypothetical protein|tara:strand:- start:14638 stop:15231 length:594 start_codon:yes stop_codon:yes gene_type:complete
MSALITKEFNEIGEVYQNTYINSDKVNPFLKQLIKTYNKQEKTSWAPLVPLDSIEVMLKDPYFEYIADFVIETIKECTPSFPEIETYQNNDSKITNWPVDPYIINVWGVVNKADTDREWTPRLHPHRHVPATWTFTYYIEACDTCSPLVFTNTDVKNAIAPRTGDLVIFPGWVTHGVGVHTCSHDRISIAGNVAVKL